jgi:hydroxysqualene dehydroxylase
MKEYDVIIIGCGLSGLSAAVELSLNRKNVLLLEQRQYCGGRVYSFIDKTTNDCIDNGQHLMMGCYRATRRYLRLIGTENLAELQPALHIDFLTPQEIMHSLKCSVLPAPLHILSGLLGFNSIPLNDRFGMCKLIKELPSISSLKENELDKLTADEWLTKHGQSDLSRKYLWDIITIGALNNHPQKVSALMLFRVLRAAFLGRRENSSLLVPRVGLSELFVNPAVQFIESHGGEVRTGVNVEGFMFKKNCIHSIQTTNDEKFIAKSFISSVPWHVFDKFQFRTAPGLSVKTKSKSHFHSSPIISIHLWFDKEITNLDFAALINTRIQWLFNKNRLLTRSNIPLKSSKQYLSLVISGAQEFIGSTNAQLVEIAIEDLKKVLPEAQDVKVVHSVIIKEKRATFSPSPGLESLRPAAQTEYENFFLAGDWTSTGLPATIEGAVISGVKAASFIK